MDSLELKFPNMVYEWRGVTRVSAAVVLFAGLSGSVIAQPSSISGFGNVLGFNVNSAGISGAAITGGTLTLMDSGAHERRTAFYAIKKDITTFFVYQAGDGTNPPADGAAFIIQNDARGLGALGDGGSALGYGGGPVATAIHPSVALEFNIFDHNKHGIQVVTNGSFGSYIDTAPVELASGHPILVRALYEGGTLDIILTDTASNGSSRISSRSIFRPRLV